MGTSDDMPATDANSETGSEAADTAEEVPPATDMDAVKAATDAHAQAVSEAHENLHTRMQAAYAEFKNGLDRAYSVWENAINDARGVEQLFPEPGGSSNEHGDPTTAR
jgi:hypothetical protein